MRLLKRKPSIILRILTCCMHTTCKLQGAFRKKKFRISTHHSLILLKDFEFCQVTCAVYLGMHVASPHSGYFSKDFNKHKQVDIMIKSDYLLLHSLYD
jgi:hypothetical protein